ncbi:MAG: tetratricopeptide repeat protein [Novosphingobium sp.]|nr:tetratricopeptide repeat protein [Novosphingobium sp.]
MALPPNTNDSAEERNRKKAEAEQETFLREVDDALRQDQFEGFFRRYGKPVIGVVLLGLAGLGGYLFWHEHNLAAADERSEQFVVALDDLEADNKQGAYEKVQPVIEDESTASATSAALLRAGLAIELGKKQEAVNIYESVAADGDAPQPMRDLANVRYVALQFDELKPQQVVDRLKPLAVPGNAWFGVAGEMVGMAYLELGKEDLAGPLFAQIARDKDVPGSLRGRTRQLAGLLGVDALDAEIGEDGEGTDGAAAKTSAAP